MNADAAVEARIRNRWNKFRQLVILLTNKDVSLIMRGKLYSSCVRSSMLHGSETWPVRKENEVALQRAELRMVRQMDVWHTSIWWPGWVWASECFFWYQPTAHPSSPEQRAVKQLCLCVCVWLLTGADFSLAQLHLAPPTSGKPRSYMATKDESSWLSWAIMLMVFVWSYVLPFWHNINMWWTHRYRTTTHSILTNHSTAKTEIEERQWTAACIVIEVSNQYRCKKTLEKKFKMLIKTFKMWGKRFKM